MLYQQRSAPPPGGEPDEFVMSDGTLDRMGDVIEPGGWQLDRIKSDPLVLFNHDRDQIVGKWADVRVKDGKLLGRIVWARSDKWPMAQYIRDLVGEGILRTVSVGFRPVAKQPLTKDADEHHGPFRFTKSELLECSLVSVPANPNALALTKDLPRDLVAEIFRKIAPEDLDRQRAAHGKLAEPLVQKSTIMTTATTISNKIQAAQQNYNVLRDALKELMTKDDHDTDEAKRYEDLPAQIEAAKAELEKHRRAERAALEDGDNTVTRGNGNGEILAPVKSDPPSAIEPRRVFAMPKKKLETGDLVLRSLACWAKSEATKEKDLGKTLRDLYGNDEMTGVILRTAVNPAQTTVATWAAELTTAENAGFLDRLIPNSIYQQLAPLGTRYTFSAGHNELKIPVRAAVTVHTTGSLAGTWIGEGGAKPVRRASFSTVSLKPTKLSVISTFTEEMANYGAPAIEGIIRQGMSDDTMIALDTYLIDAVASSATRPAGLLNGVGAITASVLTPATAAMVADLKALVAALTAQNGGRRVAILMNPAQALALGFAQTTTGDFLFTDQQQAGQKFGVSFIVSNTVPAGRVIAIDAEDFASATGDIPRFAVSTDATLHEEDTSPLALGSGVQGSGVLAVPMRSLFQTDAVAIRMSLYVSWVMRRTGMVQTIAAVTW